MKKYILLTVVCALFLLPINSTYAQSFTDVTVASGINHVYDFGDFMAGGGAVAFDYNNDGFEDVYITGGAQRDALYHNNGDGTFSNVIGTTGITARLDSFVTVGVIAGDIDNDGDKDLYVTTRSYAHNLNSWAPNLLLQNNGDGTFTDISVGAGITAQHSYSTSATFGDVNLDGYLDIYTLNFFGVPMYDVVDSNTFQWKTTNRPGSNNLLYINNGDATFNEMAVATGVEDGGCGWATAFSDYDNDGDVDLVVANDFGAKTEPNELYQNLHPSLSFSSQGVASGTAIKINAMGVGVGDYNEDGFLDYYITDMTDNFLFANNGNGTFTDVTSAAGVEDSGWVEMGSYYISVGWGANFFDYDQDTYLDLFVCNGSISPMAPGGTIDTFYNPNSLYRNTGGGTFTDVSVAQGINDPHRGRGSIVFDYDNDGDMDLMAINQVHFPGYGIGMSPQVKFYRNDNTSGTNWVKVKLEGDSSNRDGIGALVTVKVGGRSFIREIDGGSSHLSQNSTIAHFGLADYTQIDTIEVRWPGGKKDFRYNVPANQQLFIKEGTPTGINALSDKVSVDVYPNPFMNYFQLQINTSTHLGMLRLELFDSSGKRVKEVQGVQNGSRVNWEFDKGAYWYKLWDGDRLLKSDGLIAN
jgi:hypothetical protein